MGSSSDVQLIVIISGVIALAIFYFSFFDKRTSIIRKLKKNQGQKISNFQDGEIAKIIGIIESVDKLLIAPLSRRKCVYYYVHVEQKVSSGKSSYWKTLIEEELSDKFVIKDGSRYAYINDSNIKSYIIFDKTYTSVFLNDATADLESYLQKNNYKSENFLGLNKSIRYSEAILEEGESVSVFGKGEWKNAKQLHLPEKYGKVLSLSSSEEESIYLSDDPDTTKN